MMLNNLQYKAKNFVRIILMSMLVIFANSCDALHEDLEPCPQGLRLRFVYDYNMEFANAFPSQVHCLTLLVYDGAGNYIRTVTVTDRELLSDENWRMTLDLPAGDYSLLAYGGMACDGSSFSFDPQPQTTVMQNLEVNLLSSLLTDPKGPDLHPLFYGRLNVSVPENGTDYTEATVEMMKDTNDFRILLANENGDPINADDFIFTITDNNTRFNYLNDIISTENVTYYPWDWGNAHVGVLPDNDERFSVVWAEFTTSRLIQDSTAKLTVVRKADGQKALSIPLVEVLLLLKSEHFRKMGDQEFLDRESRWNLTFFLTGNGIWAGVSIVINDWIVRINNINDF